MDENRDPNVPPERKLLSNMLVDPPAGLTRLERVRFFLNQKIARRTEAMNRQVVLAYFAALEPEPKELLERGLPPLPPLGMENEIHIIFDQFPQDLRDRLISELESSGTPSSSDGAKPEIFKTTQKLS